VVAYKINNIIWITWGCFICRWFTFSIIHFVVKISGLTTCVVSDVDRLDSRGKRNLISGYHNFENQRNLGTKILTWLILKTKDSTSFSFKTPQPGQTRICDFVWHRARRGCFDTIMCRGCNLFSLLFECVMVCVGRGGKNFLRNSEIRIVYFL